MRAGTLAHRAAWWSLIALMAGLVALKTNVSWAAFTGSRVATPPPTGVTLPGREVPMLPSPHIPFLGAPHTPYNSLPPTSGPHVPWVIMTGIYSQPVPDELGVHALEHGHILIQYAPALPAAQVGQLRRIALEFPADVVLAPYPKLASGIALTAWGRIEKLNAVSRQAIARFVVTLRGRYDHGWSASWAAAHGARVTACGARLLDRSGSADQVRLIAGLGGSAVITDPILILGDRHPRSILAENGARCNGPDSCHFDGRAVVAGR